MRDIAEAAGVATGLAYRYFPSKDAIVFGVYGLHAERLDKALAKKKASDNPTTPSERMRALLDAEVDVLSPSHRRLLSALALSAMNADSPTWLFASETEPFRAHAQAHIRWVLENAALDDEAQAVLVPALWALRMGVLYFAVHDSSKHHERTRALVAEVAPLVETLLPLAPFAAPALAGIMRLLHTPRA